MKPFSGWRWGDCLCDNDFFWGEGVPKNSATSWTIWANLTATPPESSRRPRPGGRHCPSNATASQPSELNEGLGNGKETGDPRNEVSRKNDLDLVWGDLMLMTESAVALGVVGIDRLGGGVWGGGGPSRISDLQVRSGPKMGHCGQRGSEENTANTSKNGPELYIVIARNALGTAQNTVNYGKICVFAFLGRCVSSLASGDGGHKTLQIALKIGCLAFSGAIFSAR